MALAHGPTTFCLLKILLFLNKFVDCATNNACKNFEAYLNINSSPDCYYISDNDDDPPEIILKHTGVGETHEVITDDGYILTLFRIPHGDPKDVIFFQHGIVADSTSWISQYNESIAFLFWKAGYDVWLGNSRGTTYSKKHVKFSSDEEDFWNFSFHEMGYYDLSATIEYIKMKTNKSKIIYTGYSLGVATGLVYASVRPQNAEESLKLIIALAPISFLKHITTPLKNMFIFTTYVMNYKLNKIFRWYSFLPRDGLILKILRTVNRLLPYKNGILFAMSLLTGWSNSTDPNYFNLMVDKFGSDVSFKTAAHLRQIVQFNGDFKMYDYGTENNIKIYGDEKPPSYPLENISVPIFMIHCEDDTISHPDDVELLYSVVPEKVKLYGKIKLDGCNHNDIIYGRNRNEKIYNVILNFLDDISSK